MNKALGKHSMTEKQGNEKIAADTVCHDRERMLNELPEQELARVLHADEGPVHHPTHVAVLFTQLSAGAQNSEQRAQAHST